MHISQQRHTRGLAISRGLVGFILFLALIVGTIFWGIPAAKKLLVGSSLEIRYKVLAAEDDPEVMLAGLPTPKTVIALELFFPMGSAPDTENELQMWDSANKERLEVFWQDISKEDIEDQGVTRWYIKELFLPYKFREGVLKTRVRELVKIQLTDVKKVEAQP